MAIQLKGTIINMKSLSQNIGDPIIIGAAEANGRYLSIIFTQEAAAQFSDNTKVYLSWRHIQKDVKGYNVFTEIPREDDEESLLTAEELPPTWTITYPKAMLHEGDVLAHIELVDNISVSTSTNFIIHVLADPWDGTDWIEDDDLSEFKKALGKIEENTQMLERIKEILALNDIEIEEWEG